MEDWVISIRVKFNYYSLIHYSAVSILSKQLIGCSLSSLLALPAQVGLLKMGKSSFVQTSIFSDNLNASHIHL